jgi:uncharacterized membrane protein
MTSVIPTFTGVFGGYLRQPAHWIRPVFVALGGYGAALAAWELSHPAGLEAFVFQNDLGLDARRNLLVGLLAGAAAALILWVVIAFLLAPRVPSPQRWDLPARLLSLGIVLPLLPVLALPGIAARALYLVVVSVVIVAAAVFLVVRGLRSDTRQRGTSEPPSTPEQLGVKPASQPWSKRDRIGLALTILMVACYALYMTGLSVARHNAYLTNAFDLGIYDQSIYNILHSGYLRTTLFGTYAINHLSEHFSPALFLLAPIYALRQDARTLLALQSLILGAAAVPLYLLARLKTGGFWIALALVFAWLLHPALHGVNLDDFHQIALAPLFLLSALYFLETDRDIPFLICLLLALFVKEEMALTVVAVGAYVFFGKGRRGLGAGLALFGLVYLGVVTGWVMPKLGGKPQIDTRFGGFMAPETSGAEGAAWTMLTNPIFTGVHIFGNPDKLRFLSQIFVPVIFLPLLASPIAWLAVLPAFAIQTLTDAHTQYDINYHYTAHLLPLVFFVAILGLGRITSKGRSRRPVLTGILAAALVVASLSVSYLYSGALARVGSEWPQESAHDRVVDGFVAELPRDAIVSTLGGIVPHLTTRKTIYLFPDIGDAEYMLLDTDLGANYWPYEGLGARDRSLATMAGEVRSGAWGLVRAEDGVYLFQRGANPSNNEATLRQMLSTRYEAEVLQSDFPESVSADAEASGGKARTVTPQDRREDGKAAVTYGPYTKLQAGNYRATFYLKAEDAPPDSRVAVVDVFTHTDGYPRAAREVYGRDFTSPSGYQAFSVDFNTSGQPLEDVEFRVTYDFAGDLSVDRVDVDYLN